MTGWLPGQLPRLGLKTPRADHRAALVEHHLGGAGPAGERDGVRDLQHVEPWWAPSGAGKSSLGRLLAGIDAPRAGRITVGNVPVAELGPSRLRRQVVLVTQENHVFVGTLRGNLSIVAPTPRTAGSVRYSPRSPRTGSTSCPTASAPSSWRAATGSTRRRPSNARSPARVVPADPHTLILDEATALHDADRVAVMKEGRLIEVGAHDDLVARGGAYAAVWDAWHGRPAGPSW
ncbi:ATP-binding cassette domain-containing protein [Streptomyces sp. DSM 41886]|uniref:ATP-binding cassette domain-containing protein n=1 Tax=Streptomyces johnsoniae TaxID=3075532 RepID=A0ABU2S133_9ACTN|nr:ATP-binding cassette domain-containing protein [Streptomyces sp. DSM 41886]MDT0442708.1 ATP-binding cassette domain-containing protein [Streptomyces sp. DSM 41886]